jgi:hypothetical protein
VFAEAQSLSAAAEEANVMMPPLPNWGTNDEGEASLPPRLPSLRKVSGVLATWLR